MAVTIEAVGASQNAVGFLAPNWPTITQADSYMVLIVGIKPDTVTMPTPTGWDLLVNQTGGTGTTGIDTGPTRIQAFGKIVQPGETMPTGNPDLSSGGANIDWNVPFLLNKSATGTWDVAGTRGADNTAGAAWSATLLSVDVQAGDLCIVGSCIPTDVTTPAQFTAEAIALSGVTFGTMTEHAEPDSSTNNDIGGFVFSQFATAGSATGTPVVTATASGTTTNVSGPTALVRVRDIEAVTSDYTGTATLTGPGTLGASGAAAIAATASLTGAGALAATGAPALTRTAALAGSGALSAVGAPSSSATGTLSGAGTLTASGVIGSTAYTGTATLAGSGTLAATGAPGVARSATLTGAGVLAITGTPGIGRTVTLTGTGALAAAGHPALTAIVELAGDGALTITGAPEFTGALDLGGEGTLSGSGGPPREHTVAPLGRRMVLAVDLRALAVGPGARELTVPADTRRATIPADDRTNLIPHDERTVHA